MSIHFGFSVEAKGQTPALIKQVHGNKWVEYSETGSHPEADAVWTSQANTEVYVFTADCMPVLLYTPTLVSAIHCGWRGAMKGIVGAGISEFKKPVLHSIIGPCIKRCCFEVREDFIEQFEKAGHSLSSFLSGSNKHWYFDLPRFVIETQLRDLEPDQIDLRENRCTVCSSDNLPSFRRTRKTDPHIRAWIYYKG